MFDYQSEESKNRLIRENQVLRELLESLHSRVNSMESFLTKIDNVDKHIHHRITELHQRQQQKIDKILARIDALEHNNGTWDVGRNEVNAWGERLKKMIEERTDPSGLSGYPISINALSLTVKKCLLSVEKMAETVSKFDYRIHDLETSEQHEGFDDSDLQELINDLEEKIDEIEYNVKKLDRIADNHEEHIKIMLTKPSSPNGPSSDHSRCQTHLDQAENLIRLLRDSEKHLHHATKSHETGDLRKPETSHYTSCDSFPGILSRAHIVFGQTSILGGLSYRPRFQTLVTILVRHGMKALTDEQILILISLSLVPELVCHVARRVDHICIQFQSESHPGYERNEINLPLNSHNS